MGGGRWEGGSARKSGGLGGEIRREKDEPYDGEPYMSMEEAKELTRRAVREFAAFPPQADDAGVGDHEIQEAASEIATRHRNEFEAAQRGIRWGLEHAPSREQVLEDENWRLRIEIAEREDGGWRVSSDDLPGLILSGPDPITVLNSIPAAIRALQGQQGGAE